MNSFSYLLVLSIALSKPSLCQCASSSPPASMDQITNLIHNTTTRTAQCQQLNDNCNFFDNWIYDRVTKRFNVECKSDTICILTCNKFEECLDLDVFAQSNSIVIIDCIVSNACSQLNVHGKDAHYLYILSNEENAIIESQIQCPTTNTSSCVIDARCIDIYGNNRCLQSSETTTSMIKYVSIYTLSGYNDLKLICDTDAYDCFDSTFMICGTEDSQQTCWIRYDSDYDEYICDGDDIAAQKRKCTANPTSVPTLSPTQMPTLRNGIVNNETGGGFQNDSPVSPTQDISKEDGIWASFVENAFFWMYLSVTFCCLMCCCVLIFTLLILSFFW